MTDGRWTHLGHMAGSAPRPPPHATSYAQLRAPAPPEPGVDAPRLPARPGAAEIAAATGIAAATDDDFIYHPVDRRDSLMALSLRYGVPVADLKMLNNLPTENLAAVRTLRIPRDRARVVIAPTGASADDHGAKIRRLIALAIGRMPGERLSEPEARFYLEDAGWDVDAALAAWRRDEDFDASTGGAASRAASAAAAGPAVAASMAAVVPLESRGSSSAGAATAAARPDKPAEAGKAAHAASGAAAGGAAARVSADSRPARAETADPVDAEAEPLLGEGAGGADVAVGRSSGVSRMRPVAAALVGHAEPSSLPAELRRRAPGTFL